MNTRAEFYIPYVFRSFQGFDVRDIKEFINEKRMEIVLEKTAERIHRCCRCQTELGVQDGRYKVRCHHMRVMGWAVVICFWREKRFCPKCNKIRSEEVEFLCPTTPHISKELAWWINRLSEVTSVLAVSRLESLDKMACYKVDKYILTRLLQGYKIPEVTQISVDEVYARSAKQLKEGEDRDDLFLTVIVDMKTHKVIWVSQSRKKDALDEFFKLLGEEACKKIEVVATDQHEGYSASIKEHCKNAIIVWDRFHIVRNFNEALNEERKAELDKIDPEGEMEDLMNGKYRYVFLTKAKNRKSKDEWHINEVMRLNDRMAKLEMIKEHFHKIFEQSDEMAAKEMLVNVYDWAYQINAVHIAKWVLSVIDDQRLWNYFKCKVTTGISEGINRAIKGLKWQAYGYKDMFYFALKIMQKVGYLNSKYSWASV